MRSFTKIIKDGNISANVFNNTLPASISRYDMQGQVMQKAPSITGTPADTCVPPAHNANALQRQVVRDIPSTISVAEPLIHVNDR